MPRHDRPTSEETKLALDKIVKQVARKMEVSPEYLYAILGGFKNDPYAYFRAIFRGVSLVAVERTHVWLDDLRAVQREARGERAPARAQFPSELLHRVWEREVNLVRTERVPLEERRADLARLVRELTEYGEFLAGGEVSRGEAGQVRAGLREATTHEPGRAAASGLEEVGDHLPPAQDDRGDGRGRGRRGGAGVVGVAGDGGGGEEGEREGEGERESLEHEGSPFSERVARGPREASGAGV